jgi:hypothetical protein
MTPLPRSLRTMAPLAAVLTWFVAGCAGGAAPTSAPSLTATASAAGVSSASPSRFITAIPISGSSVGAGAPSGQVVYLAEGGSVGGTIVRAPRCQGGCQLSGDGTTSLWDMTWATWNTTVAVGAGTEKLDDCNPDCAAGTLHAVPVGVLLSKPVMVCVSGTGRWFWTRVSFTWPAGLPAAFSGGNAPLNPFDYPDITAQAAKSCP